MEELLPRTTLVEFCTTTVVALFQLTVNAVARLGAVQVIVSRYFNSL